MLTFLYNRLCGKPAYRIETATLSGIGGRDNQEDALAYAVQNAQAGCWVIADGVGGRGAGEIASQLAVDSILTGFRNTPACTENNLRRLLESAHQAVFTARRPNTAGADMATTAAVLITAKNRAIWGHVGDSRLYHFRDGRLMHRTADQSLLNMLVACGALPEADINHHPQRNLILHALGQDDTPAFCLHGPVSMQAGDGFLLCTDGVWELVNDIELLECWQNSRSANHWLAGLQQLLEPRAAEQNSTGKPADNYSAIAVKITAYR